MHFITTRVQRLRKREWPDDVSQGHCFRDEKDPAPACGKPRCGVRCRADGRVPLTSLATGGPPHLDAVAYTHDTRTRGKPRQEWGGDTFSGTTARSLPTPVTIPRVVYGGGQSVTSTKVEDRVTAAVLGAIGHALALTASMTWEILWALILGFALSAVVQAVVRRSTIVTLLGDDRPRTLVIATGLGAASSSCSYAAVALARSLFRKGANFTAAMAFEIGSTNLVVELGIILALLMGWQFTAAEFVGGPIMILVLAVLFRLFVGARLIDAAREQAERGLAGSMEGHAAMDMSIKREGSFWRRLLSPPGFTSIAHVFVMEWLAILRDLILGLLIAGAIAAWVPESFWQSFF